MTKIYTLAVFLAILFSSLSGLAQDPSFSQFYASRVYLNPAFTGVEQGISFSGVSRTQWAKVDGGFRTYIASVELQEPFLRSGLGLSIFHDTQGIMQLNTTSISFSYAYMIPMEKHNLHIGLQGRWVQKSVDWEKIVFSDELDPLWGEVNETTAMPLLDRTTFTDFDAGILWRFDKDVKIGQHLFRDTRTSVGLSVHHLPYLFIKNAGNESFQNLPTQTTPRLTFHAGSVMPLIYFNGKKQRIAISPNFKYDLQSNQLLNPGKGLQVFTYGLYLLYEGIYVGAMYQNRNPVPQLKHTSALIIAMGAHLNTGSKDKRSFFLGFSYDANTTGLGPRAGGVYEIALRWTLRESVGIFGKGGNRRSSKRILDCYDFF